MGSPQRRARWYQPLLATFDRDVQFSPDGNKETTAPDYDRRTAVRLQSEMARKRRIDETRLATGCSILVYACAVFYAELFSNTMISLAKVLPLGLMLRLALLLGDGRPYAWRIACGLTLSAIGDVCLEMEKAHTRLPLFLVGLGSFLGGHCAYIYAFFANPVELRPVSVLIPSLYSLCVFVAVLWPSLPSDMVVPVGAYVLVITLMMVAALSRKPEGYASLWSFRCAATGALLFAVSDTILAYNRFVGVVPGAKVAIMSTYYLAQYAITMSARGAQSRPLTRALGSVENQLASKLKGT